LKKETIDQNLNLAIDSTESW